MAQITAATVKQLRDRTQLPMMDCKKALTQADGDMDKAEAILRKSGASAAARKAGRETAEGRVAIHVAEDGSAAGIVEVRCETAPVAGTDDFVDMCKKIAHHVAENETLPEAVDELLAQPAASIPGKTVKDLVTDVINKIRENMQLVRFARVAGGRIAGYEHHNGQIAVVIQLACEGPVDAGDGQLEQFARDLCMHIAATNPTALDREGIPVEMVDKEKDIIAAQVAEQAKNKPPQIVEKIVQGKLNKWYQEQALLEQSFVKDDKKSVKQVISEFGASAGQAVAIKHYIRYEVGGTG